MKSRILRILAVLIPLAIGGGAVAYMMSTSPDAPRRPAVEIAHPMRVVAAPTLDLVPRAVGYGLADADRTWRAIARVPGRLIEIQDGMRSGGAVNAGDLLVRIDPTDTEIAIASAEAELNRLEAELNQLEVESTNNAAALEIEEASLAVASAELQRFKELLTKDAASAADVEDRQRAELTQRQTVLSIESSQAMVPGRRASLSAQLAGAQATLDNARRDRSFCEISAPFDAILGEVALELGQYVASQELLFELHDTVQMRIDAALPQNEVFRLVNEEARERILKAILDPSRRVELLGDLFEARVTTQIGGIVREWKGKVAGARESLDAETRALRLTIVIEQRREDMFNDGGPPLNRGTYCKVEVRAQPRPGVLVVPRSALRDGSVFVLDAENRLTRAELEIEFTQGELAIVSAGLEPGARVIASPPSPAILGMLIDPVVDETLIERMRVDAEGNEQ